MNFFAHASLAAERSSDAAFVLGAMLPDLCTISGARLGGAATAELGAGVRFHHASDAAFHTSAAFSAFCIGFGAVLQARGVRRGPARGAAHVAGELMLDGWLARAAGVPALYRHSLARAEALLAGSSFAPERAAAIASVCARLHAAPVPEAYAEAAFVCARVERALATRPFLALAASEQPELERAVRGAARELEGWAPEALRAVAVALDAGARSPTAEAKEAP